MDDHQLQQVAWAMQQLLSELSTLLPNEPALAEKLADLLRQLQQEPESAALVEARIHRALSRFPVAQQRWLSLLQAGAEEQSAVLRDIYTEGGTVVGGDAHVGGDFVGRDKITNHYHGVNPTVTRYSDILIPSRVAVAQRFAIIVGLTCLPTHDSRETKPLSAKAGLTVTVVLKALDELAVIGASMKEILVVIDEDSEPVVFYLSASRPGDHRVQIEFWSKGHHAFSCIQSICAVADPETVLLNQVIAEQLALEE